MAPRGVSASSCEEACLRCVWLPRLRAVVGSSAPSDCESNDAEAEAETDAEEEGNSGDGMDRRAFLEGGVRRCDTSSSGAESAAPSLSSPNTTGNCINGD